MKIDGKTYTLNTSDSSFSIPNPPFKWGTSDCAKITMCNFKPSVGDPAACQYAYGVSNCDNNTGLPFALKRQGQ